MEQVDADDHDSTIKKNAISARPTSLQPERLTLGHALEGGGQLHRPLAIRQEKRGIQAMRRTALSPTAATIRPRKLGYASGCLEVLGG